MKRYLTIIFASLVTPLLCAQSTNQNYVTTITFLDENRSDSIINIQYCDGLGRPMQTVSQGVNGKFLHTHQQYDLDGRESVLWSTVVGSTSRDCKTLSDIGTLSASCFGGDSRGYSQTIYDALNRLVFVSTPGDHWTGKGKSVSYRCNTGQEVKLYTPDNMSGSSHYAGGALFCTETTDEDNHKTQEFKDLSGNIVLLRRFDGSTLIDTYYVYDAKGRLAKVLQPMFQSESDLDKYAFQYEYDERGRMTSKKLPGCEPVHYWYDNTDHVVKMQDGILAAENSWRIYTYDALGRLTKQSVLELEDGIYWNEYEEVRNYYDTYDFLTGYTSMIPVNNVDGTNLNPINPQYGIGQLTGTWQSASNGEQMLTTYSYDDQGRVVMQKEMGLDKTLTLTGFDYNFVGDVTYEGHKLYRYDATTHSYNTAPHYGWISHNYDYLHTKLPTSSVLHLTDGTNTMTDTIASYTYDDFGHATAISRSGSAADMSYTYDNMHGWLTSISGANGQFCQQMYREDEANDPCYNGSISAMMWRAGNDYVRRYDYTYDGLNRMTAADYSYYAVGTTVNQEPTLTVMPNVGGNYEDYSVQYGYDPNSNISSVYRQGRLSTGYDTVEDDDVERDGNQLKAYDTSSVGLPYYNNMDFKDGANAGVEYSYDANGSLTRDENKGITYEYDLLGHLKLVTTSPTGNSYKKIEYVYAPDGRCLRKIQKAYWHPSPHANLCLSSDTIDFYNQYVVKNRVVDAFHFDGGYCSMSNGTVGSCHFYLRDYQGNNRMVVNAATDSIEQVTHYYPYGGLMADICTGHDFQPYKYGGKQLDRYGGLDLYDFHARQLDPLLPSFTSIDPKAEEYYSISSYAYCGGDPVNCIDPSGMNPIFNRKGIFLGVDDWGMRGEALFFDMDEKDFTNTYSHNDALMMDLGEGCLLNDNARNNYLNIYNNLPNRPDWDGYITLSEANDWYRNGNGLPLYADFGQIDMSGFRSLGDNYIGEKYIFNLLEVYGPTNDALVYGNLTFTRLPNDRVKAEGDKYDFDMHAWNSVRSVIRNIETIIGNIVAGHGKSFPIYFYGSQKLKRK